MRVALTVAAGSLLLAACTGWIGDLTGGSAGAGAKGSGAADGGAAAGALQRVPVARLTNAAYANTLAALFPKLMIPPPNLPADTVLDGFDNVSAAQTPSADLVEAYRSEAHAIAALVQADPTTVLPCAVSSAAQEASCGHQFLAQFGARAYRHPLSSDESQRLSALFDAAHASYGFAAAVGMVVEAVLQTPQFLYRIEVGAPSADRPGVSQLTGYEMASRLSYFLWNTMPDDSLTQAAAAGQLDTPAGLDAVARRMLQDPRAHAAVGRYLAEWLRFDEMVGMQKSSMLFPSFNGTVAQSMIDSANQYVSHMFWDVGGFDAFLTDTNAFVNDDLAPLYGVTSPGPTLKLVPVDPTQRAGVITQVGLLSAFAHDTEDSPVLRGVFVLRSLLCDAPPPPPAGVNTSVPTPSSGMPMTTRQEFAEQHEQGACASCHHLIDGVGFGFEHYDAVGAWRTTDNGLPVDSSGWLSGTDIDGTFDGAPDLARRMTKSAKVQTCAVSHWMAYALGLTSNDIAGIQAAPVAKAFADAHLDMRELVVALVKADAFRFLVNQ